MRPCSPSLSTLLPPPPPHFCSFHSQRSLGSRPCHVSSLNHSDDSLVSQGPARLPSSRHYLLLLFHPHSPSAACPSTSQPLGLLPASRSFNPLLRMLLFRKSMGPQLFQIWNQIPLPNTNHLLHSLSSSPWDQGQPCLAH